MNSKDLDNKRKNKFLNKEVIDEHTLETGRSSNGQKNKLILEKPIKKEFWKGGWRTYPRLKRFAHILIIFMIVVLSFYSIVRLSSIRSIDGVMEKRDINGQDYYYIESSTRFDLGYLEGQALHQQIFNLEKLIFLMALKYNSTYINLVSKAKEYLKFIPDDYIEEMQGMALGATNKLGFPISFNDILLQNTFLDIYYSYLLPRIILFSNNQNPPSTASISTPQNTQYPYDSPFGCTTIIIKNPDNASSKILFGQDFDFNNIFLPTISFTYVNFTASSKSFQVFGLRFGAMLSLPLGKNSNQVYSGVTVVPSKIFTTVSTPISVRSRNAFESAKNASDFVNTFLNTQVNKNISDSDMTPPISAPVTITVSDAASFITLDISAEHIYIYNSEPKASASQIYTNLNNQQLNLTFIYNLSYAVRTNIYIEDAMQDFMQNRTLSLDRQNYADNKVEELIMNFKNGSSGSLTMKDINTLLKDKNICQDSQGNMGVSTLAFITNEYFGTGNPQSSNWASLSSL
ncbi:MAG: hypothetical protein ACTSU2_01690 [Promethearchaeota archaeon]